MTLLAQLSDPHVAVGRGDRASARALAAAVAALGELRPRPGALLVSGDLVTDAGAREYERVRELLAPFPGPVFVIAGNHDDRDALREYFALDRSTGAVGEPFRYSATLDGLRLIGCDTTMPGRDDGSFGAEHRAWLERELAADTSRPTIVAMHHPPLLTGLTALDEIGLAPGDRRALADLLGISPQVRRVVAGHVHRGAFDVLAGCGVMTCPSTHLQAPLEIGMPEIRVVEQPGAFALHALVEGELVSHLEPLR